MKLKLFSSHTLKFICSLLCLCFITGCNTNKNKREVLVLGTIHNMHAGSNYSYGEIVNVLNSFKPDLICVEIRPQEFRKSVYLREMMIATAFGDINKIPVFPIDWWDEKNNDRVIADSLSRIEKYARLLKTADSLEKNDEKLKLFQQKYGVNIYQNNKLDMNFWNSKDFNDYVRESYKISLSVFGDSPFNLHYITRNRRMLQNIREGIRKFDAKRIIILTGGEHKSFFDDSLRTVKDYNLLALEDVSPVVSVDQEQFWTRMRSGLYYGTSDSSKADDYYFALNMPLVHGMQMDFDISYINLKNLPQTEIILRNWQADVPGSIRLFYDRAWFYFLNGDYDTAIKTATAYLDSKKFQSANFKDWGALRIIGFCYDMKNQHGDAVPYYKKAHESMTRLNMNPAVIKLFLKNYEAEPFKR